MSTTGSPPIQSPAAMALASSSVAHVTTRRARSLSSAASTVFWWVSGTLRIQPRGSRVLLPRASRNVSLSVSMISGAGIDSGILASREKIDLSYDNRREERISDVQIPLRLRRDCSGRRGRRRRRRSRLEDRGPEDALRPGARDQPEPRRLQLEPVRSRIGTGGWQRRGSEEGLEGRRPGVRGEDLAAAGRARGGGGGDREEGGTGLPRARRGREGRHAHRAGHP